MKVTTTQILLLIGILILAMMACLPLALVGLERVPSDAPATQLAATVQAMLTQNAVLPTATATQVVATQTPVPPTPTSIPPISTSVPTATPVSYCYWLKFVSDVSVPDGSIFAAGEGFAKTWRLKNVGTCAWTADTKLVFASGDQMNGPSVVALPGYVAPGQTVDVTVSLTAPHATGQHTGYWMLRSADGIVFGTGAKAQTPFFVDIRVQGELDHGEVTGRVCYPSEFNPAMILYFENAKTGETIQYSHPEAQPTFAVLLPNGRYYAYAWAPGFLLEGAYVNPDRSMKTFVIKGGQTTSGINICDWDVTRHSRGE